MPDTTVRYYDSTMTGAPALSGTVGTLISVLDACLVNGFGSVTLNSLVVASNVATGTVSAGHNLTMMGTSGPVIKIEGATPSGLNGNWRIASVPDSTTFTFATSGISDQAATGTITAKRAPAGFSKSFSGTNKAAYRSNDITGTQFYWRIDDSTTEYASASSYETMSDIDTGTSFSTGKYVTKSGTSDATARPWRLVADSKTVYLYVNDSRAGYYEGHYFGEFYPFVVDGYRALHVGTNSTSSRENSENPLRYNGNYNPNYNYYIAGRITLARSYLGSVGGVSGSFIANTNTNYMGYTLSTGNVYPNPVTSGMIVDPIYVYEGDAASTGIVRGLLRGCYSPHHYLTGANGAIIVSGAKDFLRVTVGNPNGVNGAGTVAVDITGPWS